MTSVAESIGIRSHGIAGATLATLDVASARILSLVRLASGDEGATLTRPSIEGISLWHQSDEVQRIASALPDAGSAHVG